MQATNVISTIEQVSDIDIRVIHREFIKYLNSNWILRQMQFAENIIKKSGQPNLVTMLTVSTKFSATYKKDKKSRS